MPSKIKQYATSVNVLLGLYLLAAIIASAHLIFLGNKTFNGLNIYKHYNNFIIFRQAFFHLIHSQDLYIIYPSEQYDLFKYSPTFALAMAPFALLPDWLSLIVWNCFSSILLFYALKKFKFVTEKVMVFALWFVLQENLTAIQSAQTNSIIAALMLLTFSAFENQKNHLAALFIVISAFIKIFGVVAFTLFFLYPGKLKFIRWSIIWSVILLLAPLVVIPPQQLIFLYKSWWHMLQNDHSISYGLSVMGWLKSWFGIDPPKLFIVISGAAFLMLPLIKKNQYGSIIFRKAMLASIMIWVIIFNHKAESSTFIIAVAGAAVWLFGIKPSKMLLAFVVLLFILTCLSPTDLFPRVIRKEWVEPYVLKAVPCIVLWVVILAQMMGNKLAERTD
ncbi:MAG: glycosyltransferase family 87 protein [Bacteroidota bacterium]|jgi:hypothetical protein